MSQNYNTDYKTFVCPSGTLNGGRPGDHLAAAVATDEYILQSDATNKIPATNLGYSFIAGMNENDSPDSGMAFDCGFEIASEKPNHEKYGNILFCDASVRASVGITWYTAIAYYGDATSTARVPGNTHTVQFVGDSTTKVGYPSNENGKLKSTTK